MYTSAPSGGGAAKSRFGIWLAMPGLVPRIHALAASNKDVDGRTKPAMTTIK
jgi:hypothetical protein